MTGDQPAVLDAAREHGGDFRVQRLIDLLDDQRREIARIGLEAHAAGQRHQDLPRVVLLAEEPLVEPLARAVAVAHDSPGSRRRAAGRRPSRS